MARKPLLLAAVACALVLPATASAATTVGPSDISSTGEAYICSSGGCTLYMKTPADAIGESGVITSWSVNIQQGSSARLRILRRAGGNVTSINGTAYQSFTGFSVYTFPAQVAVRAGDVIGIDTTGNTGVMFRGTPGDVFEYRSPALGDGSTVAESSNLEFPDSYDLMMLNAVVEPDADHDGLGDDSQDADDDADGVDDGADNCPNTANAGQADQDGDDIGDVCDSDVDGDGVADSSDNCVRDANADQADLDGDGSGDVCDSDDDGDGLPDTTEAALATDPRVRDSDNDGKADGTDACPTLAAATANGCPPPAAAAASAAPVSPTTGAGTSNLQVTALPKAKLALSRLPKRLSRKTLRKKGLRLTVSADQPVALHLELRAGHSVLAEKLLEQAGRTKLKARTRAKKVTLYVIATNASHKITKLHKTIRLK